MDAALATIEGDAREFGLHDRQGPWRMGLLVARSVTVNKGHGVRRDRAGDQDVSHETSWSKVSARDFAMLSGTSTKRVMKYYRAWEKAAKEGLVPRASSLEPGQEVNSLLWDRLPEWNKYYEKEHRPEVGSVPRLYPPFTAPKRGEDKSENIHMDGVFCGYSTAREQIELIEAQILTLMGPRYQLNSRSLEKFEEILLTALERVRNYETDRPEGRDTPARVG